MNTFFKSQFSYFSLSWMFHSCTLNNKLNRLHERWLSIIYNDNASSLIDLLEINSSVSVHQRNIQIFATKLYKFVNGFSLKLVSDCFKLNNMTVYNTRNRSSFYFWTVAQSHMAQNHSPTWEQKIGNLCQLIWKTFQQSQPWKKLLHNGSHMFVHVGFVETTSIRLVSFTFEYKTDFFFIVFLFYLYMICMCLYMYMWVIYIYIYIYIFIFLYFC